MANYDYAYRKVYTTSTGYRKIEATITLPSQNDLTNFGSSALYNYLGCNGENFDFEFGFGYKPIEIGLTQFALYRSIHENSSRDWDWLRKQPNTNNYYTFTQGSICRFLIATENNYIKWYVYNSSGTLLYNGEFSVSGVRYDGVGQIVRRVTSLMVPPGASGNAFNNRWTTTKVGTTTTFVNATSSNCNAGRWTTPEGQNWITLNSYNPYYNEKIDIDIR